MFLTHERNNALLNKFQLFALGVLLLPLANAADAHVLGWLEWAALYPGNIKLKTKLDTGAKTSSVDAIEIKAFKRAEVPWVRYTIPLSQRLDDSDHGKDLVLESPVLRKVKIKNHHGAPDERYVVSLTICLGGQILTIPVSLADRRHFNYPLLLGRTALMGHAVVDPGKTFSVNESCDRTSLIQPALDP